MSIKPPGGETYLPTAVGARRAFPIAGILRMVCSRFVDVCWGSFVKKRGPYRTTIGTAESRTHTPGRRIWYELPTTDQSVRDMYYET